MNKHPQKHGIFVNANRRMKIRVGLWMRLHCDHDTDMKTVNCQSVHCTIWDNTIVVHVNHGSYDANVLGECRTLWHECEQAECILDTERMRYLSVSKVTILVKSSCGSTFRNGTTLAGYGADCHYSTTLTPSFLVSSVALCFWLPHVIATFPVNVLLVSRTNEYDCLYITLQAPDL